MWPPCITCIENVMSLLDLITKIHIILNAEITSLTSCVEVIDAFYSHANKGSPPSLVSYHMMGHRLPRSVVVFVGYVLAMVKCFTFCKQRVPE